MWSFFHSSKQPLPQGDQTAGLSKIVFCTMLRRHQNEHEQRSAATSAHVQELEDCIGERKAEMQRKWADLDLKWETLEKKMRELGMSMSPSIGPSTVSLNVGGSDVYIPWSALERTEFASGIWPLGDLFGSGIVDEKRLPVSADGRVVLDESPVCVERLVNEASQRCGTKRSSRALQAEEDFPEDELPYLRHVANVLGLSSQSVRPTGGTTVLEAGKEERTLTATILDWCPGTSAGLEVLYRASRDGWTAQAFHDKCGGCASTITLARVKRRGSETTDSVVGGYSSVPWTSTSGDYHESPGAFVFLLKDGIGNGQPTKWSVKDGYRHKAVYLHESCGPTFGYNDLEVGKWEGTSTRIYMDPNGDYDTGRHFQAPSGRKLRELEVFRVRRDTLPQRDIGKGLVDCTPLCSTDTMSTKGHEVDVRRFGVAIADSLKEERVALHHARMELLQTNDKAAAFENAILALYGKHVAGGEEDPVVELSVRGPFTTKRFTTLLSTLQACPGSALAARFKDNGGWKVDQDAHGRQKISDCSPGVFSKVLDVLRLRKREGWSGRDSTKKRESTAVRVAVKSSDRAALETFVNMQFPGCEGFIMDCVRFVDANGSVKEG